jgi:hypothetical protein
MTAISQIRLVDALVQVGPLLTKIDGYSDDLFSIAPASDVGAMFSGAVGDVLLVNRIQSGWLMSLTMFTSATGITTINRLASTLGVWDIQVSYGAWNIQGFGILINTGDLAAGLSANTRTMSIGIAKVSGDTDSAPGTILQILS